MKKVLSISGGGIRGLIPAIILAEIEQRTKKPIADSFDLIAGTSTGGIITSLLSVKNDVGEYRYSATDIVSLYKEFGKTVFKRSKWKKIYTLGGLISTKYPIKPLENLLKSYFGDEKLSDLTTDTLISAYQVSNKPYPHFFKSRHAVTPQVEYDDPYLWEACRATSAAPTYFKPYKFDDTNSFIDGGVFANNPSMCAYAEAKNMWGDEEPIYLLSLGTGEDLIGYDYNKIVNWGVLQWALPFFKQTSISSTATVDYMLKVFSHGSGDIYTRLQTGLDSDTLQMDDASDENLIRLENFAEQLIINNEQTIADICEKII